MLKPPVPDHHSQSILRVENFSRRLFQVPIAHKRGPWKLLEVETSTYMFQEMVCGHEDIEGSNL
jgi:hypothetical protein